MSVGGSVRSHCVDGALPGLRRSGTLPGVDGMNFGRGRPGQSPFFPTPTIPPFRKSVLHVAFRSTEVELPVCRRHPAGCRPDRPAVPVLARFLGPPDRAGHRRRRWRPDPRRLNHTREPTASHRPAGWSKRPPRINRSAANPDIRSITGAKFQGKTPPSADRASPAVREGGRRLDFFSPQKSGGPRNPPAAGVPLRNGRPRTLRPASVQNRHSVKDGDATFTIPIPRNRWRPWTGRERVEAFLSSVKRASNFSVDLLESSTDRTAYAVDSGGQSLPPRSVIHAGTQHWLSGPHGVRPADSSGTGHRRENDPAPP